MAEQNTNTATNTDNQAVQNNATDNQQTNVDTTPTVEELIAQLAAEKAANEKNKAALDKALKEKGELTKTVRSMKTAEEQEAEAKREQQEQHDAYVAELETFKKTAEAKERYAMQGMSAEMAAKAADAEISGDMDALSQIQKQYTDQLIKEKQAEWLKTRPQPQSGTGHITMTREQIEAIKDPYEQRKAIADNIELFK